MMNICVKKLSDQDNITLPSLFISNANHSHDCLEETENLVKQGILVQIRLYLIGIIGLQKRGCFFAKRLLATTEIGSCVTVCHCERSEAISHFGHPWKQGQL
jgi:hypothetical protein